MIKSDRRQFQRLKLSKPILAVMEGSSALILDIGIGGALAEHYGETAVGQRFKLSFRFRGDNVAFVSEVVRTNVIREARGAAPAVSHTGLRFLEALADADERLQDMMVALVSRLLAAHRANASGQPTPEANEILAQVGEARRLRTRGYIRYVLRSGGWSTIASASPEQPEDGFTVAASEDVEELEVLCRTYEGADDEGRRLIRLVAELSARTVRQQ
jgi:hypothetical protein